MRYSMQSIQLVLAALVCIRLVTGLCNCERVCVVVVVSCIQEAAHRAHAGRHLSQHTASTAAATAGGPHHQQPQPQQDGGVAMEEDRPDEVLSTDNATDTGDQLGARPS